MSLGNTTLKRPGLQHETGVKVVTAIATRPTPHLRSFLHPVPPHICPCQRTCGSHRQCSPGRRLDAQPPVAVAPCPPHRTAKAFAAPWTGGVPCAHRRVATRPQRRAPQRRCRPPKVEAGATFWRSLGVKQQTPCSKSLFPAQHAARASLSERGSSGVCAPVQKQGSLPRYTWMEVCRTFAPFDEGRVSMPCRLAWSPSMDGRASTLATPRGQATIAVARGSARGLHPPTKLWTHMTCSGHFFKDT